MSRLNDTDYGKKRGLKNKNMYYMSGWERRKRIRESLSDFFPSG